jgi:hypothetical protein|tara:strand:+ start:78 stop:599 length:522 start_codon:yes stop_codon:yes gene_type:complete
MLSIGLSIIVGIIVGTNKAEERLVEYDKKYEKIEKDVSTFVDVSNPKTIRMYTKELRDILDNMSRLSKIIDKGEEIDIALGKIMDGIEQLEDQWDVTLSNDLKMKETIEVVNNHIKEVDSRFQSQLGSILDKELETIDLKIAKQFDQIENDLRDIRNMLTQIENSKVGKKIFN